MEMSWMFKFPFFWALQGLPLHARLKVEIGSLLPCMAAGFSRYHKITQESRDHKITWKSILSGFKSLVQCPLKACLFRTAWMLGLWCCCLQLSWKPWIIQTTSHSTLRFLESWAIHLPWHGHTPTSQLLVVRNTDEIHSGSQGQTLPLRKVDNCLGPF